MAKVFLSYDREDTDKARPVATALEKAGHSVWWDRHIRGGAQYSREIEQALNDADAVVVLWSRESVESAWVRDEAAAGRDSGRLIPVQLDSCTPPMGFRQYQTIDLSRTKARERASALRELRSAIDELGGPAPAPPPPTAERPEARRRNQRWPLIGAAVVVLALVAAAAIYLLSGSRSSGPVVMVQAGSTDAASKRLARDLLVSLGSAQTTVTDAPQLVDESPESRADFVFEVTQSGDRSGASGANVLLLRGSDHQVLASADLGPVTSGQDLRDQVTAKAALLLGCAVDAATLDRRKLPLLKDFISTCDQFASYFSGSDVEIIVPRLRSIVSEAPAFRPAYERLLLSESVGFLIPDEWAKDAPTNLRRNIDAARRIDADMPEADVAEAALLPLTAYADRLKLLDEAVANGPDNPLPLVARSMELMRVGRMGDAVTDAEKASRLRPLLPPGRFAYVMALIYRGQPERAANELAAAQRVLPWARNLTEAQFRLNLRYGDANEALRLLHAYGTSRAHEAFLAARLDPSERNVQRAIDTAREVFDRFGYASSYAEVLGAFDKQDELYRLLLAVPANQPDPLLTSALFRPVMDGARQDPRFLQVAKRLGLLDYWRSSGKWPDFCFDAKLPYDCKAEATKLE